MAIKKEEILDLSIEKVIYGGRGLARKNGMVIFVSGTAPGDRVSSKAVRVKKDYAEAKVLEILEPSPFRVNPPCPYSDYCGGCNWQFISYEKQLEYKQGFIEEMIKNTDKDKEFSINPIIPSSLTFGYRNKMEFSFSDRRWMLPEEKGREDKERNFALGLHVPGTFEKIIDIDGCLLQEDRGNEILRAVKEFARDSGIPAYGVKAHTGFWRYLMLRNSYKFDEWMINLVTAKKVDGPVQELASVLGELFPEASSIVNNINTRKGGTAIGETERVLAGGKYIKDKIGEFTFEISSNSFFQPNTPMAEILYRHVKDFSSLTGGETVLDLYCGTGTISMFLALGASNVIGLDISRSAIQDARRNCRINGIENCEFLCGDAMNMLSMINKVPDVLVMDPPRAGVHKKAIRQVLDMAPERIVYVSCNPSTLARDIALLGENYCVQEIQPVDLFPNTHHVESVSRLKRVV